MVFFGYALLWTRIRRHRLNSGDADNAATLYTNFCVLGKFAQFSGVAKYWLTHLAGRSPEIIEYI